MQLLHMIWAKLGGYFWMPCPKCGEMYGGHQIEPFGATVTLYEADGPHAYCVCPRCDTPELRAENERERAAVIGSLLSEAISRGDLAFRVQPGEAIRGGPFPFGR
jgi:hypothetical protein